MRLLPAGRPLRFDREPILRMRQGRRGRRSSRRRTLARSLLAAAAVATLAPGMPSDAAAAPAKARLDLRLERTPVIARHYYRKLPRIGRGGRMGANIDGGAFSLSHQQLGDLYVRKGLVRRRPKLIRRGFRAFDFAFRRQRADGSFPVDQAEEYAFFVEAVAHSVLLVRKTRYVRLYKPRLRRYARRLERAAGHMVAPAAWGAFRHRNRSYTHSGYTMGTALGLTGKLTHSPRLERYGRSAIRLALSRQRRNGVNPELGGYDVRYQMAGITYAQRYRVYYPGTRIKRRIQRMTNRGITWMKRRVDRDGYIRYRGSTRACRELSSSGRPKTPGYGYAIRGFGYWGVLQRREGLRREARRLHRYARQTGSSSCGPKRRAVRRPGGRRDGRGGLLDGLLTRTDAEDLLE